MLTPYLAALDWKCAKAKFNDCGVWCGEGVFAPSPENFSIADLKMVSFDEFCVVFYFLEFRSICQHLGIRLYY